MSPSESLAPRSRDNLETIRDFLGTLVARYCSGYVPTAVRQFPAREAKFRPMPPESWREYSSNECRGTGP